MTHRKLLLPGALALLLAAMAGGAAAKLPPLTPEAQAKADETAAKTAWSAKADAYKLCLAQDKVAAHYRRTAANPAPAPATNVPCADPGPFAYTPPEAKPLEAAGAHSPPGNASSPHNTAVPDAADGKKP
ncbi:hypothetical protein [Acidovorax sp. Leaf160]|uniref:hypothetical protein n=1 Tax=Acidovorax sp. Leaf160 TaxID=1736280 RepID=UPI0006F6DD38|nr:hypothetical protein [Acidovorax sp. Leaf160]KQR57877.1 hypothetical protein ASF94_18505 [Acidovorax sp. Leaf160]